MNAKLLLSVPLVLVFSCGSSSQTKVTIDSIRIVDDGFVQPTPPPPPSLPYEETIKGWIEYLGTNERPSRSIVAYHFELIKTDTIYTLKLTGSNTYFKDNFEWTNNEDYAPYFKFYRLDQKETKGLSEKKVFDRAIYLLSTFLNTATGKQSFLRKAKRVTLGYADEQITQLH